MNADTPAYGLWSLVIINSVVFVLFAYSFFKPRTGRDWRSFSAFSAFLVALFAEMYGFPLTIYFLSGWLQSRYPNVDWLSHDAGHLLEMMFGWKASPHFGPVPYFELRVHRRRIHFDFRGLEGPLRRAAAWRLGDHRALQLRSPSTICRLCPGDVRLPPAVANAAHARDVSRARLHVPEARTRRGARNTRLVWRRLSRVHGESTGIYPAPRSLVWVICGSIRRNEAAMTRQHAHAVLHRTRCNLGAATLLAARETNSRTLPYPRRTSTSLAAIRWH